MKMNQLSKAFLTLLVVAGFNLQIKAAELDLPPIKAPTAILEGTQRDLSAAQIAELLPWAKNTQLTLRDGLESIQDLSTTDKIERLVMIIENAVVESNPKQSELFMRFILNRGLEINKILDKELDNTQVGSPDVKLRVLIQSIKMSLNYYDVDMQVMAKKSQAPFVKFGIEYFTFLNDLNKSIFDASAQYQVQKFSLELLQWDMYRDLENVTYAPQILKINNNLNFYPTKNKEVSDSQALKYIKQMKKIIVSLDLANITIAVKKDEASNRPEVRNVNALVKWAAVLEGEANCNGRLRATGVTEGDKVKVFIDEVYLDKIKVEILTHAEKYRDSFFGFLAPVGCTGYLNKLNLDM